jgi:hypothetical protein
MQDIFEEVIGYLKGIWLKRRSRLGQKSKIKKTARHKRGR